MLQNSPFTEFLFQAWVTADVVFCQASIYSLVGISIDRFHAIFQPISYISTGSVRSNLNIVLCWAAAVAVAMPMYIDYPGFSNWNYIMEHLNKSIFDNKLRTS